MLGDTIDIPFSHSPRIQKQLQKLLKEEEAQKERTWSYYQEIKKTDKDKYLSPKIQRQMENDAIDLGDAFGMPDDD
jgi:hypothetical protein